MNKCYIFLFVVLFSACSDNELLNMKQISHGAQLYQLHCANCHQEDGSGLARLIPPIHGADFWKHAAEELPCIIKRGLKGPIQVNGIAYTLAMPAAHKLSDEEIADICIYVWQKFPETPLSFPDSVIHKKLLECAADSLMPQIPFLQTD